MKKLGAVCLLLVMSLPAGAVEDGQVMYAGGTIPALQAGVLGRFDTTSETVLSFEYGGNKLVIPYAKIDSYDSYEQVARHLGVMPAIAVGLVKKRQRRHFFQIRYHDESNLGQVAVFEVSKQLPRTLLAVLQTRSPQAHPPQTPSPATCNPSNVTKCDEKNSSQSPRPGPAVSASSR
jgi:hypothetical protein